MENKVKYVKVVFKGMLVGDSAWDKIHKINRILGTTVAETHKVINLNNDEYTTEFILVSK